MEDIQVGEYVRDCDGFIVKVNEVQEYKEDDDIWYQETTLKGTWKSMIVKHSFNIIDLIEVEDILELLCNELTKETSTIRIKDIEQLKTIKQIPKFIKTILTKEQYNSNCYRMEE